VKQQVWKYLIRRADKPDISSMIKLLKILFSLETDFSFDELAQQKGLELMLEDRLNRCIMVAELDRQIVGMCSAQILVSTAEGGMVALIEDLVVEDTRRGQGIGKELLFGIEEWAAARGVRRLQLLADCNNTSALAFYREMNWKHTQLICLHKKPPFPDGIN
jgi:GNAT superfamily N-acetyltransferase